MWRTATRQRRETRIALRQDRRIARWGEMDRRRRGKERSVSDNPMFLYAGEYESVEDAKNEEGKVKIVDKIEKPTQHGGWAGMAVGAAIGLIFPPSILVGGLLGAGTGTLIGHLEGGMSRSDLKEVGEILDIIVRRR